MKVTGPLLSETAQGSLGGLTYFHRRRSGAFVKLSNGHIDALTAAQTVQRSKFTAARQYWSYMLQSPCLRRAWYRSRRACTPQPASCYTSYMYHYLRRPITTEETPCVARVIRYADYGVVLRLADIYTMLPTSTPETACVCYGPTQYHLLVSTNVHIIDGCIIPVALPATRKNWYLRVFIDNKNVSGIINTAEIEEAEMDTTPISTIIYAAAIIDNDYWSPCDGRELSRTDYPTLFALIGTMYGAGDGSTTFNLPDFDGYFLRAGTPDGVAVAGTTAAPSGGLSVSTANANHSHGNTGSAGKSHTHGGTTDTANCSHSHTGTTDNADANHKHAVGEKYDSKDGNQTHITSSYAGRPYNYNNYVGADTSNANASHTHSFSTTTSNPAHAHIVTTGNADVDHAHTTAAANASHNHSVSGWDAVTAPKHFCLYPLIKIKNWF